MNLRLSYVTHSRLCPKGVEASVHVSPQSFRLEMKIASATSKPASFTASCTIE